MGYCRVVRNKTTVNTYIDIYCSLVSRTVVLSTAAESHNLKCICCWCHPSGVDQMMEGEWMPVESCAAGCSIGRQLTVLVPSREPDVVVASLVVELGRSGIVLCCSPYVWSSMTVRSDVVTPFVQRVLTPFGDTYSFWCEQWMNEWMNAVCSLVRLVFILCSRCSACLAIG